MKYMPLTSINRRTYLVCVCVATLALSACSLLQPKSSTPPSYYALEAARPNTPLIVRSPPLAKAPTLIISPVRAASGFDSQRIIYVREPHKLEYFSHSEWIDAPARMLGPLMVAAIEQTGAFRAVVMTPGSAGGELRLDSEIVRLQQDFQSKPSAVQFTLRVYLVEEKTRKVLAWHSFDNRTTANSDDPRGGVIAANHAVEAVLSELAEFLVQRPQYSPDTKKVQDP
ncbi:MAG: ABC-type transport auxiliary lipoprotein family protein [Rhodoferax sp.]|jgi:cholesterol transport system auxiliary component